MGLLLPEPEFTEDGLLPDLGGCPGSLCGGAGLPPRRCSRLVFFCHL